MRDAASPPVLFLAALLALAAMVAPVPARAAACCGSGHGLGQRLGAMERAAAGLTLRFEDRYGVHRANADFAAIPAGSVDLETRVELTWLIKPIPRLQLGAAVPALFNVRRLGETTGTGGGMGDVSALARWDLVPLGDPGPWPSIAISAGITLPTGRPAEASRDALAADATGLGAAEFRPGLVLEKTFAEVFAVNASASAGFRTPPFSTVPGGVRLGPRYRILAAAGPVFASGLSLAAGLVHEREPEPTIAGVTYPGTDRRRTAALAFAAYDLHPRWTLLGSLELDIPADGAGKNEPARLAAAFSLRHVWANHD